MREYLQNQRSMFQTLSKNERDFLLEAISLNCRADARTAKETRLIRQA